MKRAVEFGAIKQSRAAVEDLKLLDLIRFIPGCSIPTLAALSAQHPGTVRERSYLLQQAGLVELERESSDCGRPHWIVFPRGLPHV